MTAKRSHGQAVPGLLHAPRPWSTSRSEHHTFTCQGQKSLIRAARGVSSNAMDGHRDAQATGRGPLPDEALDALVVVLDEVRLGRSRSRSELVARTGLGRAIVA